MKKDGPSPKDGSGPSRHTSGDDPRVVRKASTRMIETRFEEIGNQAIKRAEQIPVSLEKFLDGLKDIGEMIQERIDQVTKEIG